MYVGDNVLLSLRLFEALASPSLFLNHYDNMPMLYTAIFHGCKKR